jgi:hypothetical protein
MQDKTIYEYATLVSTIGLTKKAEDATPQELAKIISMSLGKVVANTTKGLDKLRGGGWEIINHQMTYIGHALVITFLIKRPKTQPLPENTSADSL